jgi:hypothetical protein
MEHIRAVLSQCGVAMELHGHTRPDGSNTPITLVLIRPAELNLYRAELAKSNPDYRHAVMGQLAIMYANRIFQGMGTEISQSPWTYNASEDTYTRGN